MGSDPDARDPAYMWMDLHATEVFQWKSLDSGCMLCKWWLCYIFVNYIDL